MDTCKIDKMAFIKGTGLPCLAAVMLLLCMIVPLPAVAQDAPQTTTPESLVAAETKSKPQLVPIVLDAEHNDPEAVKVVEKIYNDWIKENKKDYQLGKVEARYLPIQKDGSSDRFIYAVLYDEPLGGCFARGCHTIILYSKGNNQWEGVFRAFIQNAWYDKNSMSKSPANLVFTSNNENKNPGIWLWNGLGYQLVNKK